MKLQLDEYLLEDIQNPEHPSDFTALQDECMLILRLPEIAKGSVEIVSNAFVVKGMECFVYKRETEEFERLGTLDDLNHFLEQKTQRLIKEIKLYYLEVDMLEETLFEQSGSSDFMAQWLLYKKDLSLIHRLMFDAAVSFDLFIKYNKKHTDFQELAYADVEDQIERIRDLAKASLDKLENLYNFYRAKVDERMNKNIYYLTLLSGVFLPLTLVSGFFGMNTGGLPFTQESDGTLKVVLISLVLEIIVFLPFLLSTLSNRTKRFKRCK